MAGLGAVDEAAVQRAAVAARHDLDAWLLPRIERGSYPEPEEWLDGRKLYDVVLAHLGMPAEARPAGIAELERIDEGMGLWNKVLPDVLPALEALRAQGLRLGVVSNADGRVAQQLVQTGLSEFFEVVLDSSLEGISKPKPEIFARALERMGCAAERTLYVGDIYSVDVVAATQAGLHGVLIDRTGLYHGPPRATERVADLLELAALLAE